MQPPLPFTSMKNLLILLAHLLTTIAKLLRPGGARAIVADSLLMKQQLLIINRSRRRAPNFSALERFLFGFWSLFLNPRRIHQAAVIIRPSTLLNFHDMLNKRKYRLLYSSGRKGKPGPKGRGVKILMQLPSPSTPKSSAPFRTTAPALRVARRSRARYRRSRWRSRIAG